VFHFLINRQRIGDRDPTGWTPETRLSVYLDVEFCWHCHRHATFWIRPGSQFAWVANVARGWINGCECENECECLTAVARVHFKELLMSRQLAGGKTFQENNFLRHYIVSYFIFLNQRNVRWNVVIFWWQAVCCRFYHCCFSSEFFNKFIYHTFISLLFIFDVLVHFDFPFSNVFIVMLYILICTTVFNIYCWVIPPFKESIKPYLSMKNKYSV